jgi:hypothetical protein
MHSTLQKEEISFKFTNHFFVTISLFKASLENSRKVYQNITEDDVNEILMLLSNDYLLEYSDEILANIYNYLEEFRVTLLNIDELKIISELSYILINKINKNCQEEDKRLKLVRIIYYTTLQSYIILLKKNGRVLHTNNIRKMTKIIEEDRAEEFYPKRTLYYIFRNCIDLEVIE